MVNRRTFIASATAALAAAGADAATGAPPRAAASMPPGALSLSRFARSCTGCALCVSSCPEKVLAQAGLFDYGLKGMLLPKLDFSRGACDPSCSRCADVCPAGALERFDGIARRRLQTGVAEWNREDCRTTKGETCRLCSERCPRGAVTLVEEGDGPGHPAVDASRCVGCGRCENYCPAERKAIRVRALDPQDLAFGDETLLALLADGTEWTSRARGVKPLLDMIDGRIGRFAGARCYDRIVGRAAAFLYAKIGVASVYSPVMSKGAEAILRHHGIEARFARIVPEIRNRKGDGPCPMDDSVRALSDGETDAALETLRRTAARLAGERSGG